MNLRIKITKSVRAVKQKMRRWSEPGTILLTAFLLIGTVLTTISDAANLLNALSGESNTESRRPKLVTEAGLTRVSEFSKDRELRDLKDFLSLLSDDTDGTLSGDDQEASRNSEDSEMTDGEQIVPDEDAAEKTDPDSETLKEADQEKPENPEEMENFHSEPVLFFRDVRDSSSYYYRPVYWAVSRNLTNGVSERYFGPEQTCTRAQIVTFLWRAAGEPEPVSTESPFADVGEGDYFQNAVLWAVEQGITQGTEEGTFDPEGLCTRAQCVTFLWRFFGAPDDGIRSVFKDVPEEAYYGASVFWALKYGVTNGTDPNLFSPDAVCTRAQTVTFFFRSMIEKTVREELPEQERPSGEILPVEFNGTTGEFEIRATGIDSSSVDEVRAAVWTKEDQSDIRWFTMDAGTNNDYGITLNVKSFGRFFGNYHSGLYIQTSSGENVQQIHLENCSFQLIPSNYMYAENMGKGFLKVHVLGVAPEIKALQIIGYGEYTDPEKYDVAEAELQSDGTWTAIVDWLSFMDDGNCYLEERPVGWDTGLNTIAVKVHPFKQVIDVSQHQGTINWQSAKNSGRFEAVIIRCGLRSAKGKLVTDTKFYRNADACRDLGIPMGVYWFTSALTVEEAEEEADYCASLIGSYPLSYPVFLDTEWGNRNGLNSLDKGIRTACIQAFLNRMKSYGYETGVYASQDWIQHYLDYSAIEDEIIWYASWKGRSRTFTDYASWQYATKASIPGIPENTVDMSHWFE